MVHVMEFSGLLMMHKTYYFTSPAHQSSGPDKQREKYKWTLMLVNLVFHNDLLYPSVHSLHLCLYQPFCLQFYILMPILRIDQLFLKIVFFSSWKKSAVIFWNGYLPISLSIAGVLGFLGSYFSHVIHFFLLFLYLDKVLARIPFLLLSFASWILLYVLCAGVLMFLL